MNQNRLIMFLTIAVVLFLLIGEAKGRIQKRKSSMARPSNRQVQGDSLVISPDNATYGAISASGLKRWTA